MLLFGALQNGTAAGRFCAPFSLLGDICADDMPTMRGCEGFQGLCAAPGSVVAQCREEGPIKHVLLSMEAEQVRAGGCRWLGARWTQGWLLGCDRAPGWEELGFKIEAAANW